MIDAYGLATPIGPSSLLLQLRESLSAAGREAMVGFGRAIFEGLMTGEFNPIQAAAEAPQELRVQASKSGIDLAEVFSQLKADHDRIRQMLSSTGCPDSREAEERHPGPTKLDTFNVHRSPKGDGALI